MAKPIVFYSWQSDLPAKTNKNALKNGIKNALQASSLDWELDEATRKMSGSVNIPNTILEKIRSADVFVADITPVHKTQKKTEAATSEERAAPNPNVVFELGYAVAHLGWERVILVNNLTYGEISDAPFDFDRHRISTYSLNEEMSDPAAKPTLNKLLKTAIEAVLNDAPLRPHDFSQEHAERARDTKLLKDLMERIHWPTISKACNDGPHYRYGDALSIYEAILPLLNSPVFHIYDVKLSKKIDRFMKSFHKAHKYDTCYHSSANPDVYVFTNPGDMPLLGEKEKKWNKIKKACKSLYGDMHSLLHYIRRNYPEVDIIDSNKSAYETIIKD